MNHYYDSLELYKSQAIKAARELGYGSDIIKKLEQATSNVGITNIMKTARKQMCEKEDK